MESKVKATEEQLVYANLLSIGMKIGMLMLIVSFLVYVSGILTPHVPVDDLPKLWSMSVHDYLEKTNVHSGWGWFTMLNKGDFLNFFGIAFLSAVTMVCFIRIIPILFRKNDRVYGVIAIIEVVVLVLAASGILKGGGH
ncbi:MAG: hypothetical protein L3V56_06190 [Candidatus Magnetoovum sp. WYHC-5]|nr:hypothetical protein [Candidatus Magnetoovum sp. WYHC-5]